MYSKHARSALVLMSLAWATFAPVEAADLPSITPIPNQDVFISQLVRVAEVNPVAGNPALGFFGTPTGADPLSSGQVAVRKDRRVTVQVRSAAVTTTYSALFCRFGFPSNPGCLNLGQFPTDSDGDANSTLTFPSQTQGLDTWTGQFVLLRNGAAQFVSGFSLPPAAPAPSAGVELQITGQILSLNVGSRAIQLAGLPLPIFTDTFTKFDGGGIDSLTDLHAGLEIEVTGFTRPDSTIYATHVHLTNKSKRDD